MDEDEILEHEISGAFWLLIGVICTFVGFASLLLKQSVDSITYALFGVIFTAGIVLDGFGLIKLFWKKDTL